MKLLTKIATATSLILVCCHALFAAEQISAYHGPRGDVLLTRTGGQPRIMIAGGALPKGGATAGDCFAQAPLALKKPPRYYEGNFLSAHNDLISVGEADVAGKGIGVYLFDDHIDVGGAEVDGICADGIDFSGRYIGQRSDSDSYARIFIYFMSLAHENANYLFKQKKTSDALETLRPFVEAYQSDWLDRPAAIKAMIPAINDYAFMLQSVKRDADALPLLKIVTQKDPARTVAWLNLADAYWQAKDIANARQSYARYISLMNGINRTNMIPSRALERMHN